MAYILKQFDTPLAYFEMERDHSGAKVSSLSFEESHIDLLPLGMERSEHGLAKWLWGRVIPSNRAYVQNFLAKVGLGEKDTKGIIDFCHGLSLTDSYWVIDEGFDGKFTDYNLYENPFSRILGQIAFTGFGSYLPSSLRSSPEFTTNGMLPKCWRRINGSLYLFKGGTEGASNAGNEPFCEFYASQVGISAGFDVIPYGLSRWMGRLCSTCLLFTSKDVSFLPIGSIVRDGGIEAAIAFCKDLGGEYYQSLCDMFVFDALILNTDRHFGNFGFLVDNKTNKIVAPAPLFDHGLSLLTYALEDDLKDKEAFIKTRYPATYSDFMDMARRHLGPSQREKLRRLLDFSFSKHPRYNWSNFRLRQISSMIRERSRELLS